MHEGGNSVEQNIGTPAPFGQPIPSLDVVTPDMFEGLVAQGRPAVLRGAARHWPLVEQARISARAAGDYLKRFDTDRPVQVWLGEPAIQGRFFYGETLDNLNFQKFDAPVSPTLDHLLAQADAEMPQSVFIQSMSVADHLPGLLPQLNLDLVPGVAPRIWIGNQLRVQTHYDPVDNIACVAAGRRRFTLFAPEQMANLYIGPLYKTVAGAPISLASLENPDFERFPRLRAAMGNALYADLEPGDALYIPYFWWHHVQSLSDFNILVNFWWDRAPAQHAEAMDAFVHALLAVRRLPEGKRDIWKAMFEHYVFDVNGDAAAHLSDADKGILGAVPDSDLAQMQQKLLARLAGRWRPTSV